MLTIAHLSDTQIRNFKRHKEFRQSYDNLYQSLREKKPDIIVIAGDIAHTKTQISPEFVQLCSEFFSNLAKIAPLIIIPGNHDGNLKNLERLDALTPIIQALNDPNIYYYKKSGVYPLPRAFNGNVAVFSCFDENWPTKEQIDDSIDGINNQVIIGLYHGFIQGATLQNGMPVDNCPHKLEYFLDLVDYLMVGDIHMMQFLDSDKRAAYCGSYPQQNFGEDIEKGYLLWSIESKKKHTVEFIQLPNVCPFYTILVNDDLKVPTISLQKRARIRVVSRQLTSVEKKAVADRIATLYEPRELYFKDISNPYGQEITVGKNITIEDLRDVGVQEKLIKKFLDKYEVSEDTFKKILLLNRRLDAHVRNEEDTLRNVQYRLGKMRWSNLFSFGEDNEFDFSERQGLVGVFGKNAVGKSSLAVDIPLYSLFNTNSKKVIKNDLLINEKKDFCSAEMEIYLGDNLYKIARKTEVYVKSGKRKGLPVLQGSTDVSFSIVNSLGNEQSKTAEKRADTDLEIRKVFGTADDFMTTAVAPQWKLINFLEKGGTERQKLIGRFFDVDVFDTKYELAKEEFKDIKTKFKVFENRNIEEEIEKEKRELAEVIEKLTDLDEKQRLLSEKLQSLDEPRVKKALKREGQFLDKKDYISYIEETLKSPDLFDWADGLQALDSVKSWLKSSIIHAVSLNKKSIIELENKLKTLKNYPCVSNSNCCMLQEIEKVNNAKLDLEARNTCFNAELTENKLWIEQKIIPLQNKIQEILKAQDDSVREKRAQVLSTLNMINDKKLSLARSQGALESYIKSLEKELVEYQRIGEEYQIYEYYLMAMSKDGISKDIIANNLSVINNEIDKIMLMSAGFSFELVAEEDGKQIEIYYKNEKGMRRVIELCSGMEKTLGSIAIRAALIRVTTLPKPNVYILDEVFSALDPEYMDAVNGMLEYLKTLFDSVIIITHIDSFKDLVDHVIEIERDEEGFARVV